MQTFLPYRDFVMSARCLDNRRLGKQRVEAFQLLDAINGLTKWRHHPAARMWRGYEQALRQYLRCCITEWVDRGYRNAMVVPEEQDAEMPWWLGDERLHSSHRSNLLRKQRAHYGRFGWSESDDMPYWWPVNRELALLQGVESEWNDRTLMKGGNDAAI